MKNGQLFLAFLNLYSVFDSVSRKLLIKILLEISLESCFVVIIEDRYRRVTFNGKFSRLATSRVGNVIS